MAQVLPLQTSNNANTNTTKTGKSIEEIFQKKTQLEHILLRPDTYIGSVEKHEASLWVYTPEGDLTQKPVSYVPGLYKIFDEILVNAADNKQRDIKMDRLEVEINKEENLISVYNTGDGIPVEMHKEEGVFVPELIFGHLLTSSNYNDHEKKTTGGRNGYGAKLTNIFSTYFVVETADGHRQLKYKQVFSDNMTVKGKPVTQKCKATENWTKVTFKPDLAKFKMTHLEDDVVALMKKRVVDMAGCLASCPGKRVKVILNGKEVEAKSFYDYAQLYLNTANKTRENPLPRIDNNGKEDVNPRWQISVSQSDGQFQQVSFVNSINTIKGGSHVNYITEQITKRIVEVVKKKNKHANLKPHIVKNHLWIFVNALIDNPAFDSQTKESLTTRATSFGTTCELSDKFLKKVIDGSGVVESLLSWADFKMSKDLKKTDGTKTRKITDVPKLVDAPEAGGSKSERCTLILTEGDSAKALAMAGLSAVQNRELYGVFPLRGKLLNVREASAKQITENHEIQSIKKILGLKQGEKYDKDNSVKSLRYGHLMIMTDQDHDGSHIKGLIINFIHTFWPALLRHESFMLEFITPIVKATRKGSKKRIESFYTMRDYEDWVTAQGSDVKNWTIKYYKGLGTSDSNEGKEYFSSIEKHRKIFIWQDQQDGDAIELAFSKKKIEARKDWLRDDELGSILDHKDEKIKYSDFVHKELKLFSRADLQRSIPCMVDGLKPTQRKVLFAAFKRNLVNEIKVAQFSGYVSEKSCYHHGEVSIQTTIVGMAQDFIGTNNVNLLTPNGQFGTRAMGGKDAASARYIHTKLADSTRFLFPKDDDVLLDYLKEDGLTIEPQWYMPIIPLVLVNGSEGIGTGWSTFIPNYNPRDIVANVRRMLKEEAVKPMDPWYNKFRGTIIKSATKETGVTYTVSGIIDVIEEDMSERVGEDDVQLRITELPIRKWTQDYKDFLVGLEKDGFIKDHDDRSTNDIVHIDVILTRHNYNKAVQEGLLKKFKLTSNLSTSNMHLFDEDNKMVKYESPEQILEKFVPLRLQYYKKRKEKFLEIYEADLVKLDNQVRFILGVVENEIVVCKRKKAELVNELREKGFTPLPKNKSGEPAVVGTEDNEGTDENEESAASTSTLLSDYDYLLNMAIGSLTLEKVQELCANRDKILTLIEELKRETDKSLWLKDLDALEKALDDKDKKEEDEAREAVSKHKQMMNPMKVGRKVTKKATKAKPAVNTLAPEVPAVMEIDNPPQKPKPRGRAADTKKAPAKKVVESEDEDDDLPDLRKRLADYHLDDSSPDISAAMETDAPAAAAATKKAPRRAATKKSTTVISDDSDDDDEFSFESEIAAAPEAGKKGRGKAATSKAPKATGAPKKRGPASKQSQKLITESFKPAETAEDSPDKKVRRMRPSPFNKKSGSVLNNEGSSNTSSMASLDESDAASTLDSIEEVTEIVPAKTRPVRANRRQTTYVLSDSDTEASEDNFDVSETDEDDDE